VHERVDDHERARRNVQKRRLAKRAVARAEDAEGGVLELAGPGQVVGGVRERLHAQPGEPEPAAVSGEYRKMRMKQIP
jgi:hypothetical protein